jgi:hypothetical protein
MSGRIPSEFSGSQVGNPTTSLLPGFHEPEATRWLLVAIPLKMLTMLDSLTVDQAVQARAFIKAGNARS